MSVECHNRNVIHTVYDDKITKQNDRPGKIFRIFAPPGIFISVRGDMYKKQTRRKWCAVYKVTSVQNNVSLNIFDKSRVFIFNDDMVKTTNVLFHFHLFVYQL